MNDVDIKQHIFQTAGLGLSPYKFLGVTENMFCPPGGTAKPGGSCDYCSTGIRYEFHLRSADGREFKVGSDCICKAGDAGLKIHVASHKTKLRRLAALAKKHALVAQKIALIEEIKSFLLAHKETLDTVPHPYGGERWNYVLGRGVKQTWFDYAYWMLCHCGVPALLKLQAEVFQKFDDTSAAIANHTTPNLI